RPEDVTSLNNWLEGNGCLSREESAYLQEPYDLLTVAAPEDGALSWLVAVIEGLQARFRRHFVKVRGASASWRLLQVRSRMCWTNAFQGPLLGISRDPNVHITSHGMAAYRAR